MPTLFRLLADVVVVVHAGYVLFVVIGLLVIVVGVACGWQGVRNPWFRWIHLAMIGIVVFEALWNITCPLTTLENLLRAQAGETVRQGSFIARVAHDLIFWNAAPWVFTVSYCLFGVLVLLTFWLAPPRPFRRREGDRGDREYRGRSTSARNGKCFHGRLEAGGNCDGEREARLGLADRIADCHGVQCGLWKERSD